MHPVLFEIPGLGFPIRSFGVLVAAGFLTGLWVWGRLLARFGEDPQADPERGAQVAMWVLFGILGGARLMYVAVESARYLAADQTPGVQRYFASDERGRVAAELSVNAPEELELARRLSVGHDFLHEPLKIFKIWEGGLVMYGGFFGAALLGMWAARRTSLNPLNALDTALPAAFVGQAIGRWGCLLVGDDYGAVVPESKADLPFPITIRVPDLAWLEAHPESLFDHDLAGKTLWATQTWMSFNALLVALVAYLVLKRRRWYGQVAAVVLVHYSVTRFLIEAFRGDEIRGMWFGGLVSTSQLIAIPGALLGGFLLLRFAKRDDLKGAPALGRV